MQISGLSDRIHETLLTHEVNYCDDNAIILLKKREELDSVT